MAKNIILDKKIEKLGLDKIILKKLKDKNINIIKDLCFF